MNYKAALARALYKSGVLERIWHFKGPNAFIVMYHGFCDEPREPWLENDILPVTHFRKQLDFFQRQYSVIHLEELLYRIKHKLAPRTRSVVICFDDALCSLSHYAIPELLSRGMPFTVGVPAGLINSGRSLWEYEIALLVHLAERRDCMLRLIRLFYSLASEMGLCQACPSSLERSYLPHKVLTHVKRCLREHIPSECRLRLINQLVAEFEPHLGDYLVEDGRFRLMSWEHLKSLSSADGLVVSHGFFHHPHNKTLSEECRLAEFERSRVEIELNLGETTRTFIWPEGVANKDSIHLGLSMGYEYFLTTRPAQIDCSTTPVDIPRVSGQWPLPQLLWNTL